jgi:hypothetical protein
VLVLLVSANLKFVISIAKEYQGQRVITFGLISEGNYGLLKLLIDLTILEVLDLFLMV